MKWQTPTNISKSLKALFDETNELSYFFIIIFLVCVFVELEIFFFLNVILNVKGAQMPGRKRVGNKI